MLSSLMAKLGAMVWSQTKTQPFEWSPRGSIGTHKVEVDWMKDLQNDPKIGHLIQIGSLAVGRSLLLHYILIFL